MERDPRFVVLDELISAGFGNTPGRKIPADWRTRKPIAIIDAPNEADISPLDPLVEAVLEERVARIDLQPHRIGTRSRFRSVSLERKCAEMRQMMSGKRRTA